jgi:hypothetical protein
LVTSSSWLSSSSWLMRVGGIGNGIVVLIDRGWCYWLLSSTCVLFLFSSSSSSFSSSTMSSVGALIEYLQYDVVSAVELASIWLARMPKMDLRHIRFFAVCLVWVWIYILGAWFRNCDAKSIYRNVKWFGLTVCAGKLLLIRCAGHPLTHQFVLFLSQWDFRTSKIAWNFIVVDQVSSLCASRITNQTNIIDGACLGDECIPQNDVTKQRDASCHQSLPSLSQIGSTKKNLLEFSFTCLATRVSSNQNDNKMSILWASSPTNTCNTGVTSVFVTCNPDCKMSTQRCC